MTLEELKQELGVSLKKVKTYGVDAYYIEHRFSTTQTVNASELTKYEIIKMVRKLRNDCLLWCDDIIGFANDTEVP